MDHLGLDLGTTTISAAVLDADGRLLCTRTVPGGAAVAGQPWERKQDARGIEHAALSLLDGLLQEFPDIGCVGLTGQMHGIVYVDAAGQLLSPLYTWQDETGAQPGPDGKSTAARLTARTGYPLASGYGLVTLACHQAAGTIPDGAAAVCTIADYLAMRLSGRTAPRLTPSMAASLGLFDGTDFDRKAVRRAGLPEQLLPEVSEKAELGGGRLHIFAALGDNQASFLGAGQGRLDAPLVNIGTGSQFSFFTKEHRTVPGLEHVRIVRNAYAIEYDCINSLQLKSTLEFKKIRGLFAGGQFNGSSGYEEAAAQGLIAGINAALEVKGQEQLILDRSEAYIGVLIDDLVTKENHEPYRMMTSRAEYRLLLRQDNADLRLRKKGYQAGLISEEDYQKILTKEEQIKTEISRVEHTNIGANKEVQTLLESYNSTPLKSGTTLAELIRRPELSYEAIKPLDKERPELPWDVQEQVDINIKYDGYIRRQLKQVEQFKKLEAKKIPTDLDYEKVGSLRIEARQKLEAYRPISIGQASRISGVSPADISVLLVYLSSTK